MAPTKSVISQLQTASEGLLEKLTQSGATRSALQSAQNLKDAAARALKGLESIEARLAAIEERLTALETARPKRTATKTAAVAEKPAARAKKPAD